MNNQDLDWLAGQQPHPGAADPSARERARLELLQHTAQSPQRRGFRVPALLRSRTVAFAATAGVAAAGAAVVLSAGSTSHHAGHRHVVSIAARPVVHPHRHAVTVHKSPLVKLADYVVGTTPSGDATLVQRTTTLAGKAPITVYDLYADNGKYYFSSDEAGLQGQVSSGHNLAGGLFAREVAAAKLGATGNVNTAAQDMADAPNPSHVVSRRQPSINKAAVAKKLKAMGVSPKDAAADESGSLFDNWAWEDSQDAIIAGAGDPQVRAGVLRILATLPGVTVTNGTADGQATLVLTGGAPEVGANYSEQLTINAQTGVPIKFVGGAPSNPATTVDYQVSRVTLASLPQAAGGH
jgi:hypothetical protein